MIDTLLVNIPRLRPPSFWADKELVPGRYLVMTLHRPSATTDLPGNIIAVEPQPYLEFNFLVKNALGVITDSGGVTEETTVLGIPCFTLRNSTERPQTVTIGTNELIGTEMRALPPTLDRLFAGKWKRGAIPDKWDGRTGERVAAILEKILSA